MDKPFAITLDVGSSLANHTGTWRVERPVYVDGLPPCNDACPAGENVQRWLFHAEEGRYEEAWRQLVDDNPLPAIMGRVCYRPCETSCNRTRLDEAVGINSVERFLGDHALENGWSFAPPASPTGKRVLVVGSGPAGLSAAYHLARAGHGVEIREAESAPGGMMRFGIPRYRLSRTVVQAEIDRVLRLGIELRLNTPVTDVAAALEEEGFDAVFLAVGAGIGARTYIPAGDSAHIVDAVSFLHGLEGDDRPRLGRRVVVYGGGNTAMDAARTARRLGATDALVVYRRNQERMPAHPSELAEAEEEGVVVKWLSTIARADGEHLMLERMELDASGFPQPTGQFEDLDADAVLLALGQHSDLSLLRDLGDVEITDGVARVNGAMMTAHPGVFAGGDMVPGDRTVTTAVGHGKAAARNIDAWLRGQQYQHPSRPAVAAFEALNTWYYADAPRTVRPRLETARRLTTFDEVVEGLDEETALFEARRCLSCGNCFECDNCFGVCPDNAVRKLGPGRRYAFDYDYCKGCGLCVAECPCGAITLVPEQL